MNCAKIHSTNLLKLNNLRLNLCAEYTRRK